MKGYSFRSLTDLVLKIFKTKVNAGTGLSGGGSLEADRTLTVEYGTAAGTAAQGNDSRLSNSREWTAATISQAETEAGTESTRRAFTAQRVRQAIVAWWNNVTGVFGRDLVTSADNTDARNKLGLFTSALRWPTWAEVTNKPTSFPSSSHTHPWSQVTGQPVTATRWPSLAEVTGTPDNYPTTWGSVAAKPVQATRWPTFEEVTNKPTTYTPSSHTHPWAQVTGQPTTATRWPTLAEVTDKPANYPTTWGSVEAKPAQATRWPTFAEVSDKPTTYTPSSHTHPTSQITGLDAALNTKAITSTQVIAGTGLVGGGTLAANRTLSIATSHTPIGVGQTWHNVLSSRQLNTTYTNTTGRPIQVSISVTNGANIGGNAQFVVDKVTIAADGASSHSWSMNIFASIPAGSSYSLISTAQGVTFKIRSWAELR